MAALENRPGQWLTVRQTVEAQGGMERWQQLGCFIRSQGVGQA